ncbi:MAG: ROK family protein [Methylacidiphilaceae bacterium]|nr:ROK family protein [Candidatus Methylacidiphilaceae bacterium]
MAKNKGKAQGNPTDGKPVKTSEKTLVLDVGGHHVKIYASDHPEPREIATGPAFTPQILVRETRRLASDWEYSRVAIGYPGPVREGRPAEEPLHLGPGWTSFDFAKGFEVPVRIVNDAAMQALGSYRGGDMLFLGLGTGLGSALVVEGVLQPLQFEAVPYRKGKTVEDYVGEAGLKRLGHRKWRGHVRRVVTLLRYIVQADYVILGGGNARLLKKLPADCFLGENALAFPGGLRLWEGLPRELCGKRIEPREGGDEVQAAAE